MEEGKAKLLELLQEEAFVDRLAAAKTPEEGCMILLEKGLKVTPEDFEKIVAGLDEELSDDQMEAVAGGFSDTNNQFINVGGTQYNYNFNYTTTTIINNVVNNNIIINVND